MKTGTEPIRVFIAYSRQDSEMKDRLLKALYPLIRRELITVWHDGKIPFGKEWEAAIEGELANADIIMPLLSVDSLYSYYFSDKEMTTAFEREREGECWIIPILLRACPWKFSRFSKIQMLPLDAEQKRLKAVSKWVDEDSAFTQIVEVVGDWVLEKRGGEARKIAGEEARLRVIETEKEHKGKEQERIAREKREAEARRISEFKVEKERKLQEQIEREKREVEQRRLAEAKRARQTAFLQNLMSDMVLVKGGIFEMGATEEQTDILGRAKPVHQVTLDSYYISKYAVTFAQYDVFCEVTGREKPSDSDWGRGKHPVIYVNWYDAVEYCNWLSEQSGLAPCYQIDKSVKDVNNHNDYDKLKWVVKCDFSVDGFRLPTEAEWESGAQGTGQKIRFGNEKNIWEWCWDWDGEYSSGSVHNPKGARSGTLRVRRGSGVEPLFFLFRLIFNPVGGYRSYGFRLARTLI